MTWVLHKEMKTHSGQSWRGVTADRGELMVTPGRTSRGLLVLCLQIRGSPSSVQRETSSARALGLSREKGEVRETPRSWVFLECQWAKYGQYVLKPISLEGCERVRLLPSP